MTVVPHVIIAMCSACRAPRGLTPDQLHLNICTSHPKLSEYHFVCPKCHEFVSKPATDAVVRLLRQHLAEASISEWTVPAEAQEQHTGAVICLDDVIALGLALRASEVTS